MNKSREEEIEENIRLWEEYLKEYEFNKRWNLYTSIAKRISDRYGKQHMEQGELE